MTEMLDIQERYRASGIWTMENNRASCVVPEKPLLITPEEERDLIDLSRGVWQSLESIVESVRNNTNEWSEISNPAFAFPQGLTLPPAVRIDCVRTTSGPKIVEVDPITAISLGETALLTDIWCDEAGYATPVGLVERVAVVIEASDTDGIDLTLPRDKRVYEAEVAYFGKKLAEYGIRPSSETLRLSAFMEDPANRKWINKNPKLLCGQNPLWGSLCGLATKTNLQLLARFEKRLLPSFLPQFYERSMLAALEPGTYVVEKPIKGTGSLAVRAVTTKEAMAATGKVIFQELLRPIEDDYGTCITPKGTLLFDAQWITRLSLYASSRGLIGAQATARQKEGAFTKAHGQADAVQTTIAVIGNSRSSSLNYNEKE